MMTCAPHRTHELSDHLHQSTLSWTRVGEREREREREREERREREGGRGERWEWEGGCGEGGNLRHMAKDAGVANMFQHFN